MNGLLATVGAQIGAAAKPKKMPILPPDIKKVPLAANQYVQQAQKKTHIVIHHTAGGNAAGTINWWVTDPKKIATAYVIDRDGTILECFDPRHWASHLGVKGFPGLEKSSIGIELAAWGGVTKAPADDPKGKYKKGDFISYTKTKVPALEVVQADWRGQKFFHKYTDAQIQALKSLLVYLMEKFGIAFQPDRKDFWQYRGAKDLPPGVWSHTTVRTDKEDIFPQPELISAVMSL